MRLLLTTFLFYDLHQADRSTNTQTLEDIDQRALQLLTTPFSGLFSKRYTSMDIHPTKESGASNALLHLCMSGSIECCLSLHFFIQFILLHNVSSALYSQSMLWIDKQKKKESFLLLAEPAKALIWSWVLNPRLYLCFFCLPHISKRFGQNILKYMANKQKHN